VRNRGPMRSLRGTVSIPKVVSKRRVKCAEQVSQSQKCSRRRSFRRLPLNAELRSVGQVSARNSLPSRRERNRARGVGALLQHGWVQSSLRWSCCQRALRTLHARGRTCGHHIRSA
jgi:hypothetical protein